jgi:hypothetical protein
MFSMKLFATTLECLSQESAVTVWHCQSRGREPSRMNRYLGQTVLDLHLPPCLLEDDDF